MWKRPHTDILKLTLLSEAKLSLSLPRCLLSRRRPSRLAPQCPARGPCAAAGSPWLKLKIIIWLQSSAHNQRVIGLSHYQEELEGGRNWL